MARVAARSAAAAFPLALLAVAAIAPAITIMARALAPGGAVDASGVVEIVTRASTLRALATTLGLAVGGVVLSAALGIPAAWALHVARWRGAGWVRAWLSTAFVLPTLVVGLAFHALADMFGVQPPAIVLIVAAFAFYNVAVVERVVGATWGDLDPRERIAAQALGAAPWRAFVHVTLPRLRGPIAQAAALTFMFCVTSFGTVLVLGGTRVRTLETEVWVRITAYLDVRSAAVLSLMQLAITMVALGLAARATRRVARRTTTHRHLNRNSRWAFLAAAPAAILVSAPLIALVRRSLIERNHFTWDHYIRLASQPPLAVLPEPVWKAALTSLQYTAAATAIAVLASASVAVLARLSPRFGQWVQGAAAVPLGLSTVFLGFGLLILYSPEWGGFSLARSGFLVPLAQAVVATPLLTRTVIDAVMTVDPRQRAAAATLGASPLQVVRQIDWPSTRRAWAVGIGLAAAVSLGEFGATSFVARPDAPTLTTAIYRLFSLPGADSVGMGFAAAVVLAVITAAVMASAEAVASRGEVRR